MAQAFARPDPFFDSHNKRYESLTPDDVLLMPQKTDVYPEATKVATRITRHVSSKNPAISAAMDRVTEAPMSIAMAKAGGMGVIHRLLTPELQAKEVIRVHYEMTRLIKSPVTKQETMTVQELLNWLDGRRKSGKTAFDTHPIVDTKARLVGLVGGKEIRYCRDKSLPLGKIMTRFRDLVKAGPGTSPEDAYEMMMSFQVSALLLVDDDRTLFGMYLLTDLERKFSSDNGGYNLDENGELAAAAAVGTNPGELVRVEALLAAKVNLIVLDTAHGHSNAAAKQIREIKKMSRNRVDILAGNVATAAGAIFLAESGADGIKVGIGPGSICTTRIVAGIGVPQLTAVHACARAVRRFGIPVCADGGVRSSGDLVKLLGVGASSVMSGSLLAGTDESPGTLSIIRGREVKEYRGMGSEAVMAVNADRYRQKRDNFVAEGIETNVPYRGSVARVITTLTNGLRAGLAYNGARSIVELQKMAMFTRISNNGLIESHPHDVLFYDN